MSGKIVGTYNRGQMDTLLTPELADDAARRRVLQFLQTMEAAILEANCEVMGKQIPNLNQQSFLRMAVRTAELRADYIAFGLKVAEQRHPDPASIEKLATLRAAFEEMVAVFEAAERVIKRGYVKLG